MKTDLDIELITSPANARIKYLRKLRQKKNDLDDLFLIFGNHHLGSAIEAGWEISQCYFTAEVPESTFGKEILKNIQAKGGELFQIPQPIFGEITDKELSYGMVGVCKKKFFDLDDIRDEDRLIALVQPQDPGNVGTILRTLDSVGGGALVLVNGGVNPFHPTLLRASMGSIFWNPIVLAGFKELDQWRRTNGFTLIGTSARGTVQEWDIPLTPKPILFFGSEQKGLTEDQLLACDRLISIPMRGHHSSLNLAIAAGIILYKIQKMI